MLENRPPRTDDELLSAYFDGEITPEERARVEVLRHTSPAAATELESYAELSQLLKALPRETAPPEVRAAVVQLAERTSLLAALVQRPVRRWRFVREAVIFFAGCAATVVITIAVQPSRQQLATEGRNGVTFTAQPRMMADRPSEPVDSLTAHTASDFSEAADGFGARLSDGVSLEEQPRFSGTAIKPNTAIGAGGLPASKEFGVATAPAPAEAGFVEVGKQTEAEQKTAVPVGDVVVNFFAVGNVSENYVSNVDVYDKNPQAGADQLQKILVSNGIAVSNPAEDKAAQPDRDNARTAEKRIELESQRPAVYLEAPIEPVTRSLEQLAQRPEMIGVRLRPPLDLPLDGDHLGEAAQNRARRIDVERLKVEYNRNLDLVSNGELLADLEAPVSATEALQRESQEPALSESVAQQEMNRRFASPRQQSSRSVSLKMSPQGQAAPSDPVPPIPLQQQLDPAANSLYRFNVPATNSASRASSGQSQGAAVAAPRTQGVSEEAALRRRLANYYGNTSNVRMLIVFQEAASAPAPVQSNTTAAPIVPPTSRPVPAAPQQR